MTRGGARSIARLVLALVVPVAFLIPAAGAWFSEERPSSNQSSTGSALEEVVPEPVFRGTVYVREAGRANPYAVVLVHGLGEPASHDWEHVIPVLARRYHVLTFDLPGFGRSQKQNALYSPDSYAAFLKWLLDERVEGPFTLVGHSMGGVVALRFASLYRRNLLHLVLIDTPGILHRSVAFGSAAAFAAGTRSDSSRSGAMDIVESIKGTILSKMGSRLPTPDADAILGSYGLREKILKGRPDLIAGLALAQEDFSRTLQFVTVPVTLVWGTRDTVAPIRIAKALVAQLPRARLIEMAGVGHTPMTEDPDGFDRLLLQNITARPPDAAAPPQAAPSGRAGRFSNEPGRTVSGAYTTLEVEDCTDITLDNVTAHSIQVKNSTVRIENSRIEGGARAMEAYDSRITMTGGLLSGDVAIVADRSELDLAGVRIRGKKAVATTGDWAKLVLSISSAYLGDEVWYLHGIEELSPETSPWPRPSR